MTTTSHTNRSTKGQLRKLGLLGTTALIAGFGFAPLAYAQDDATPESASTEMLNELDDEDTVVVTGIRASLKAARDLKRNADTAIDSITASDVSTLPDLSVAEALARVPGVVVQRFSLGGNEGDFPSPEGGGNLIRGLTLVRSEFNGRDSFSANGGRALDFGTIPPELIGAVDVYKNSTADLIEGGIGGTINLRTLEPFDRDGLIAVATVDGTYTDLRKEFSPDYSILLGNRWDTGLGEFGLLGSFSASELKSDLNGFQIGQLVPFTVPDEQIPEEFRAGPGEVQEPFNIALPAGFQLRTNEVDRTRDSYYVAGQWRSNDGNLLATAKYSRIENEVDSDERTLEYFSDGESFGSFELVGGELGASPFQSAGLPLCNGSNDPNPRDPVCEQTRAVTGIYEEGVISNQLRDWTGARGSNASNLGINQQDTSSTDDISLNVKWNPTDSLFVNLDAHKTTAEFTRQRLWAGSRFFADYSIRPDLDNPSVTLFTDPNSNPGGNGFVRGPNPGPLSGGTNNPENSYLLFAADQFQDNEGDLYALRGDVEYESDSDGWFDGIKVGARFADREQVNRDSGLNWAAVAAPWAGGYLPYSNLQDPTAFERVSFTNFFRGGVLNGSNTEVIFPDRNLLQNYSQFVDFVNNEPLISGEGRQPDWYPCFDATCLTRPDADGNQTARGGSSDVREKTQNYYARLNFGNEFDNGMAVTGNIGLRYTKTNVESNGGINFVPISDTRTTLEGDDPNNPTGPAPSDFSPDLVDYLNQVNTVSTLKTSDDRWLPSLNVKWDVNDDFLVRVAASRAMTRPNIADLGSVATRVAQLQFVRDPALEEGEVGPPIDIRAGTINEFGGNPFLKPILSDNYDLSFEYYYGDNNSLTLNLFKKDIRNNIIYASQTRDVLDLDGDPVAVVFNGQLNQDKADIKGLEFAYQQFFDELPGVLSNFGVQANYTYIDAETNAPVPFTDADGDGAPDSFERIYRYGVNDFLGLSKHTANLIGIYQDEKAEVRLAYNWRSEHLSSYRDFVTGNPIFQQDRGYLDGSIKYDFTENVQFRFQVANILDTVAKANQQIDASGQQFGRTAFVGDRRIRVGLRFQY